MNAKSDISLKKVWRGYSPTETDTVIAEMQREICDLKTRLQAAEDQVRQYQQLADTEEAEQNQPSENKWMADLLARTADAAEETERAAYKKADEIIESARREAALMTEKAIADSKAVKTALAAIGQQLAELTARIGTATKEVPGYSEPSPAQTDETPSEPKTESGNDIYNNFMAHMEQAGQQAEYHPKAPRSTARREIIGRFGD